MSEIPKYPEYTREALRWVTEEYPERLRDMEDWIVCRIFWDRWEGNATIRETWDNVVVQTRALIEAKLAALDNVLDLQEKTEQLTVSMLAEAEKENWHLYAEIDTFVQFLYQKLERYMASYQARKAMGLNVSIPGSVYNMRDTIQVVKMLAEMGVPKEKVLGMKFGLSKAMHGSSEMKDIASSNLPEEKKQEKIMEVLDQIVNPKISFDDFMLSKKIRSAGIDKSTTTIDGVIVTLPQGEILQIRSPSTPFTKAIQHALKGLVEGWSPVDAVNLATQLTDEIYTKDKYKLTSLIDGELVQGKEGITLPTQSRFTELCWIQLGRTMRYLNEIMELSPDGSAQMTIFEIGIKCRTKEELEKHLREQFRTNVLGITMSLEKAIRNFYKVPEEIETLFDKATLEVWWRQGTALEVRLTCMQLGGSEITLLSEDVGLESKPSI